MDETPRQPAYDVILLVEQALTAADAAQVVALHEELETDLDVVYHALIPVEDAAARVEATLGSLAAGEVMATPAMLMSDEDFARVREECEEQSERALVTTLTLIRDTGARAEGSIVHGNPVDALVEKVAELDGREAIILTRPHLVAEFFHVDWTSKARRKLGVPVLHLLEHAQVKAT